MNNMNGGQQTRICRKVTVRLRAEFKLHDSNAGELLEEDARMSVFLDGVIAAARKGLAKTPQASAMFSNAVTTTLSDGSTITVLTPTRAATFVEWFTAAMGMPVETPVETVAKLLKEHGHLVNPTQVEEMKKRTDRGELTGMRVDGWGNWFPHQDGDSVSVGRAIRAGLRWYVYVYGLAGGDRWNVDRRVLLCNLDASKLGL